MDNYKSMIRGFDTKSFHVEYDVPGKVLKVIECLALLTEMKQGGAKENSNHCEALQQY